MREGVVSLTVVVLREFAWGNLDAEREIGGWEAWHRGEKPGLSSRILGGNHSSAPERGFDPVDGTPPQAKQVIAWQDLGPQNQPHA